MQIKTNKKRQNVLRRFPKWKSGLHFPRWQKIWAVLSAVCLLAALILGIFRGHIVQSLTDQNEARRWVQDGGRAAQVSCFFRDGSYPTEDKIRELNYNIGKDLEKASLKAANEGADLFIWCASGTGSTTVSFKGNESTVTAIGVIGNFFDFHLFHYLRGGPFLTDSEMRDQVIIDEYTAWKLFGSNNVVGQSVEIGGVNHLVSGVIERPSGRFARQAGITENSSICIMSYKSLLQYTSQSAQPTQNTEESGQKSTSESRLDLPGGIFPIEVQAAEAVEESAAGGTAAAAQQESAAPTESSAQENTGQAQTAQEAETSSTAQQAQENENSASEDVGTQNTVYTDSGRISCYEAVMPEPVDNFAVNIVRDRAGDSSDVNVVSNSSRYSTTSLLRDLAGFANRSMQVSGYTLPYWENIARGWESVLSLVVLFELILLAVPILFAVFLVIYYFRHRKWTAGKVFTNIKDRIYEKQSEAKYGKTGEIKGLSKLTDEDDEGTEKLDRSENTNRK